MSDQVVEEKQVAGIKKIQYTAIGKSIQRSDAVEKVTGSAIFIDDLKFPRMLYMKVKRAGIPHGLIKTIDYTQAEEISGVWKVITRDHVSEEDKRILFGICISDQPPMAFEKVRFEGEIVAVIIAESEKIAQQAVKTIKVKYEELPFILDPIKSANSNNLIHERNGTYKHLSTYVPIPNTNIFYKYQLKKDNFNDPFANADVSVEINDFEYPLMSHVAIEPQGAIARWDPSGELHLWSSTQSPFVVREVLSDMFQLPMNKININVPFLGGGFGGKSDYTIEPILAFVSRYIPSGYHVKFILTREEVFIGSLLGRGMKGRMKIGAKQDGTFVGLEAEQYFSDGAYGDTGINIVLAAGHNCAGPYYFDHINSKSFGVYTNTPPVGAYRGYGHPEGQFMMERLIEQLALKLNMDSKIIREKNLLSPDRGKTNSLGQLITKENGNVGECFNKMIDALNSTKLPEETNKYIYGRGFVALVKSPVQATNASSCVFLKFNEDLTVNISIGAVEIGQGSNTVLAQIAAETLKRPVGDIRVNSEINTQLTPYEWQTVASMTTMRVGNAIIDACEIAINKFKQNASIVLKVPINDLIYDGQLVFPCNHPEKGITLNKLVMGYQYDDGHTIGSPILSTGSAVVRNVTFPDLDTGQYQPYEWTFGAQGCDIRIEKSTGKIKVLHFVTVLDAGKIINPETAKGQIMGGVIQGLGAALSEKIEFNEKGLMKTKNLLQYKIPTISDAPDKYTCIFVENPQPNGPFGARPIAEHPIIGPPSCVLNAIQSSTGISFTQLPVTPKLMLSKLNQKRSN